MTDQISIELNLSRIQADQSVVQQLAGAADTWNDYLKTPAARTWIQAEAARLLNVTKLFKEPMPATHFQDIINGDEVVHAITNAMNVDDVSKQQFFRFVDHTLRGLVIGMAYRVLADIEIRAMLAALQNENGVAA